MNSILKQEPESICILRLSAIGDVCHAISSVQAIQKRYPKAKITWIIGKIEQRLIEHLPNVTFVIFDKSKGFHAYLQLKKDLIEVVGKKGSFDVLLHMQLALRANVAAFFVPAVVKLGFSKERCKELHSLAVNHHIETSIGFHVLDGFRDFARTIGVEDSSPEWDIPQDDHVKQWTNYSLPKKPFVVISPAASKAERDWLTYRYASIVDYCANKGLEVVLTGSPNPREKKLVENILKHCHTKPINLVGQTSLKQLLATLGKAEFVIAPDSGPAHMAVTQNTPVIGLYAHSNPKRTGPYLYQDLVVDAYTPLAEKAFNLPAAELDWGLRLKGDKLMASISIQQVKDKIDQIIR